jgi:hypothetical protein
MLASRSHLLCHWQYSCVDIRLFFVDKRFLCKHLKVKVKVTLVQALRLCTGRTAHRGSRGIALLFHDHGPRRGWGVSVTPRPLFTPRERSGTHFTGGWVGPRDGLDRCGKSRPPPGFDPRTVQPVASCYTDWATRPTKHFNIYTISAGECDCYRIIWRLTWILFHLSVNWWAVD